MGVGEQIKMQRAQTIAVMLFATLSLVACGGSDYDHQQALLEKQQREAEKNKKASMALFRSARCRMTEDLGDDGANPPDCYSNGKRQGLWGFKFTSGDVMVVPVVDNISHGEMRYRWFHGMTETGSYVNGKKQGLWVRVYPEHLLCLEKTYQDDILVSRNECY